MTLEDNIDKLTAMMDKLAARDSEVNRIFKPQIYQSKRRGQSRNFFDAHNYDRVNYRNIYRSNSSDMRIQYAYNRCRPRYEQNYRREKFRGNMRPYQHPGIQNSREYRGNYRNEKYSRDRGRSRSRERSFSRNSNISRINNNSTSNSRSQSGSRVSTHRVRIRCYKFREYDHFTKDCPTSKEEREIEQIQQVFNLDKEQTSLKALTTDTYDSFNKINSIENTRQEHLNLQKVRMMPPHFCL